MVIRTIAALFLLLLVGCHAGESRPESISLVDAEALEARGERREAAFAYANLLHSLKERMDFEACLARARIFERLFSLQVVDLPDFHSQFPSLRYLLGEDSGAVLLAESARQSFLVLSEVSSEEARGECAARIASIFLTKAEKPDLRVRSLGQPLLEIILLLEVASIFESVHLSLNRSSSRDRLEHILESLSESYLALSDSPGVLPFAREQWREIAQVYRKRIPVIRTSELMPPLKRWEQRIFLFDLSQNLKEATSWADRATVERTSNGDQKECERSYRNALRHLVFVGEFFPRKDTSFENVLSSLSVVLRGWKTVWFQES